MCTEGARLGSYGLSSVGELEPLTNKWSVAVCLGISFAGDNNTIKCGLTHPHSLTLCLNSGHAIYSLAPYATVDPHPQIQYSTSHLAPATYKNASRGRLSRNEFAGPVLGLGHKSALELLLVLAVGLLLLLLGVVGAQLGLLAAAQEGGGPP